ncbi:MAG: Cas10/Cmr2 second palm domain-containing protein, partial [Saprospiraceae bacterium]
RELEKRIRTQRNKPVVQHGLSLMITERARRTGKAGIDWSKRNNEVLDNSTKQKESLYEKKDNKVKDALFSKFIPEDANEKYGQYMKEAPEDIDKLMKGQEGEWLAIMHADGNNLGKIIQAMMTELETAEEDEPKEQVDKLREGLCERLADFSIRVDKATRKTARIVTSKIILEKFEKNSNSQDQLPFRPVILGGDDITIIIRGDLAFDFTREYLKEFEKQTKEYFKDFGIEKLEKGLTACAGIAYVKPHYPFHYALHLSEKLCGVSKEISKGMVKDEENPKSCLMFHRVHSSFIDDYSNIKERELKAKSSGTRFDFGPYFMDKTAPDSYTTACQLKKWAIISNQKDSPKSGLRNWLSDLQVNSGRAEQRMKRIRTITPNYYDEELGLKNEIIERGEDKYTHIHDAITLASILKGEDYEQ